MYVVGWVFRQLASEGLGRYETVVHVGGVLLARKKLDERLGDLERLWWEKLSRRD
jgi:hypothetical protein